MSVMLMPNRLQDSAMSENDQVKPLAHRIILDEDEALSMEMRKFHNRKCLMWGGCLSAVLLILAVIILVLTLTVFHVKDPVLKINSVMIQGLDSNLVRGTNLTVIADVSVKNPNVASFRFNNVTTSLFYDDNVIAVATTPPGLAKARRTILMNVTMVVLVDRLLVVPRLQNDLSIGALPLSSDTEIRGKVKMLNIYKKHVVVKMNCTMIVDIGSRSVQDQNCRKRVST